MMEWTDDCSGKKNYDGVVVSVSSRYWPQGGGFFLLDNNTGEFQGNETRPHIRPSAISSILLGDENDYITLAEKEFEGASLEEIKAQVEDWVSHNVLRIENLLKHEFGVIEGE